MKILITGDVSDSEISKFDISKFDKKYLDLIKKQDLVIFNLEGPIKVFDKKEYYTQFRQNVFKDSILKILNKINNFLFNKQQILVYSSLNIMYLLKYPKKTLVTLANNHIKDLGFSGFKDTINILLKNYINYIGGGYSLNDIKDTFIFKDFAIININQLAVKKFFFPFHLYSARKKEYGASHLNESQLKEKILKLKKKKYKIILIIHSGEELAKSSKDLKIDFNKIKELNADCTIIHHPHLYVKTKYEKYNIFVIGDFLFKSGNKKLNPDRPSALVRIEKKNNRFKIKLDKFVTNKVYNYESS